MWSVAGWRFEALYRAWDLSITALASSPPSLATPTPANRALGSAAGVARNFATRDALAEAPRPADRATGPERHWHAQNRAQRTMRPAQSIIRVSASDYEYLRVIH